MSTFGIIFVCINLFWRFISVKPTELIIPSENFTTVISCSKLPMIEHGMVKLTHAVLQPGTEARFSCVNGYKLTGPAFRICKQNGQWEASSVQPGGRTLCIKVDKISIPITLECVDPPEIPFGTIARYNRPFREGTKIFYECDHGYRMSDRSNQGLTCRAGNWDDILPVCIPILSCQSPSSIVNGRWSVIRNHDPLIDYQVGDTIKYECLEGYKLLGESVIECTTQQMWSHVAPLCIPNTEARVYCSGGTYLSHGTCACDGRELSFCKPYMPGTKVTCACDRGYHLVGDDTNICLRDGSWMGRTPTCMKDEIERKSSSSFHVSTLAIIIATACSILGLLLFVMVIVIFRRHKPRPRLYPGSPAPPPYTRVHSNSISDHDRMALISCDARRFPLPSYEEAISAPQVAVARPTEFTPLPHVPVTLRSALAATRQLPIDHRIPCIAEVYGSRDTVNVSMSDASTSVTVETFDSGASNPSMTSRRAHTGSLHSASTCSIITEDAPLLDGTHSDGVNTHESAEDIKDEGHM